MLILAKFPQIKDYMNDNNKNIAENSGYVSNIFGRRITLSKASMIKILMH